eukprot:scaffold925_cov150-Skeletonema_menzelii.AAC.4
MSSKKSSSRTCSDSGGGSNNRLTISDRRMAQASQDQYEVDLDEEYQHDWIGYGDGVHSASASGAQVTRNLQSPTRLHSERTARISGSNPRPSAPPQPNSSYSTPVKKKSSNGGVSSTPDTVASTPSPLSSTDGISPMFGRSSSRTHRSSPRSSPRGSPKNSRTNLVPLSDFIVVDMDEDEALARRLEQEMKDAELAAILERAERAQNLARHRQAAAAFAVESGDSFDSNGPSRPSRRDGQSIEDTAPSTTCRDKSVYYGIRLAVFTVVSGVTLVVLVLIFGGPKAVVDPNTWMPNWPENPNDVGKVGEHSMWVADLVDNGLNLVVLNSLDKGSDWNGFFLESIKDWDNGTPDSVTLKIKRVTSDPECSPVRRTMKVCNGDYGPTDWRGVNQIILANDYIISSVAKMNDYYLEGTNRAQKLYTMCHELGHGLGLGHFDENFYNKDLGNCMDYTERPEINMRPDQSNFMVLAELYGTVNESDISTGKTVAVEEKLENNDGNRQLSLDEQQFFDKYATFLSYDPIDISEFHDAMDGWRLLRRTDNAVYHQKDLPDGYSIRSAILLA